MRPLDLLANLAGTLQYLSGAVEDRPNAHLIQFGKLDDRCYLAYMAMKYDPAEMKSVAGDLNSGSEDIQAQLKTLKGRVDSLVGEGFSGGSGAPAFDSAYNNWDTSAKQLFDVLTSIGQALNQSGSDAEGFDADLASRFNG